MENPTEKSKTKKPRLTWARQKHSKGLARSFDGVRGWHLNFGDMQHIAFVAPYYKTMRTVGMPDGWYWYCNRNDALHIDWMNTAASGGVVPDEDVAKGDCRDYIKGCLELAGIL